MTLHRLGETYHCRPSEILGLEDSWTAYQVDVVCLVAGVRAEQEPQKRPGPKKYRDPSPRVSKVMKIPESGVW